MLNVGIIGAGDFAAAHAKTLTRLGDARLVAAARTNAAALEKFCARFGCRAYADYRQLLADPGVDAVLIATPHHRHTEPVLAAAAAGKAILLEKPMAGSADECDRQLAAVRRHGVPFMVGHVNHFVPAYQSAKALLDSGEFGGIVYAASTMCRPWMTPNRRGWHLDRASGGGIWMTIGVHVLDQLCWLIDSPVASVSAQLQTRFHDQQADDVGVAFLRFGATATATATAVGYRRGVFQFTTELTCDGGLLRIDHGGGVQIGRDGAWRRLPGTACSDWMAAALYREWRAFIDALRDGREMPVGGGYARRVMAVAFAAEESSRRRAEVTLA